MKYALLAYRAPETTAPGARAEERPTEANSHTGDGVFDDWVAYTRAVKSAGVLVAAEQLQAVDTATSVRLMALGEVPQRCSLKFPSLERR